MRKAERKESIVVTVNTQAEVYTSDLVKKYGVSEDTIERDLKALEAEGRVERFHGGVKRLSYQARRDTADPVVNLSVETTGIQAISKLIQDNQAIILDWSPVTTQLARYLPTDLSATVITNSPAIATSFSGHKQVEVRIIGGRLQNEVLIPTEEEETSFLKNMVHAHLCVLGLCNLDLKVGISVPDLDQAKFRKAMISNASNVVVQVSNENLGSASPYIIGPFSKITHIVIDNSVSDEMLNPYKDSGITILRG